MATPFPTDPLTAMQLVASAHLESQAAFQQLLVSSGDDPARIELHKRYRERTLELLELLRLHNQSGLAPSAWDLLPVVQPLVQQSLIEADLLSAHGRSEQSEQLRAWAVDLAAQSLSPLGFASVRRSQANHRAAEGRFNEALSELEDVREAFHQAGEVIEVAQTALDQASVLEWLGDLDRALEALQSARALVGSPEGAPDPIINQTAESAWQEMESITSGAGPTGEAARAAALWRVSVELLEHEARIRKSQGDHVTAAALFTKVLPHYQSIGTGAAIEYQLAAIDCASGRYAEARQRIERFEPAFASGLFSGRRAGLLLLQAMVALGLGDPNRALTLTEQGIAELESHPDEDLGWRLNWRRALALRQQGRSTDALAAYAQALSCLDSLRKSPLGYRLDSLALKAKLPLVAEAVALAAECGDAAACLTFVELVKARALTCALSLSPTDCRPRSAQELEFEEVSRQLDALDYQSYAGVGTGQELRKKRPVLLERRSQLMEQIRLRDPRWRGLTLPPPFDPQRLLHQLQARRQAAVTLYVQGDLVLSVWLIDGRLKLGQRRLEPGVSSLIEEYAGNLVRSRPDPFTLDPADVPLDAEMFLPSELLEEASRATSLLVIPHERLHLLPWPALPFQGRRLFERVAVGILPNLSCAVLPSEGPQRAPRAGFVGVSVYPGLGQLEELPQAAVELDRLVAFYPDRLVAPPLLNAEATEAAVRQLASRTDVDSAILHFACHGVLSTEDPMGSGLLLADGKIDAAEWSQMRLRYQEVVLSACSTGWRPLTVQGITLHGDDVLGLPGAFLEAGARSVVVSLSKATDSASAAFMTLYHRHRSTGTPPLAAFQQAQVQMLGSGHEAYQWAGFVCYGAV